MKNFRIICFVTIAIVLGGSLSSYSQFLEPSTGVLDMHRSRFEYHTKLRSKFEINSEDYYKLRLVITPAFQPESFFEIRRSDSTYQVLYKKTRKNIWYAKDKWESVEVDHFEAEISAEDADSIVFLFEHELSKVCYPTFEMLGYDGVGYYISTYNKSGNVNSPLGTSLEEIQLLESLMKRVEHASGTKVSLTMEERQRLRDFITESKRIPNSKDYENFHIANKFLLENKNASAEKLDKREREEFENSALRLQKELILLLSNGQFNKQNVVSLTESVNSWFLNSMDFAVTVGFVGSEMEQKRKLKLLDEMKEDNFFLDFIKHVNEKM